MSKDSAKPQASPDPEPSSLADTGRQILRSVLGIVCLVALLYGVFRGEALLHPHEQSAFSNDNPATPFSAKEICGNMPQSERPILLEMAAGKYIQPWLDAAGNQFHRFCPNVHIKLLSMDDLDAARAILTGQLHPTIWAPTHEFLLRYLEHARRPATPAVDLNSQADLIESPVVVLFWEDRLNLLSFLLREQPSEEGQWVRGLCAGIPRDPSLAGLPVESMKPGTWEDLYAPLLSQPTPKRGALAQNIRPSGDGMLPSLETVALWGGVKIGHPWPTRFAGGIASLYLLSQDYLLPPRTMDTPHDAQSSHPSSSEVEAALATSREALRKWLRRCEAGLELPLISEQALTEAMFTQGPHYLDAVVTYEHLALPLLERIDSNALALKRMALLYPRPTLVARHPAVIFQSDPEQKEAAQHWIEFLRSPAIQELAIPLGFRPANKDVSVRDFDSLRNRFLRLRRYGVLPAPKLVEAPKPSGRVVAELMEIWGEATGRN